MENTIEKLIEGFAGSLSSNETLDNITNILEKQTSESLSSFVSSSLQHLRIIEHWIWQEFGKDFRKWTDNYYYVDFVHMMASFNMKLVQNTFIESDTKAYLLIPDSIDWVNAIFDQIETINTEDNPYWFMISRWLNVLSHLVYENTQLVELSAIIQINHHIQRNFIMTNQFKFYLSQLRQPNVSQAIFTPKQQFYMKTCLLSLKAYVSSKVQHIPYTGEQILEYVADDFFQITLIQSFTVDSWSIELLGCIAHLNNAIASCCWWDTNITSHIKTLLPFEHIAHDLIQAFIRIIVHTPFHKQITTDWSNEITMLIDSTMLLLFSSLDIENIRCYVRSNTSLSDILIPMAETLPYNRICLCAYGILARILSDEELKEMKVANHMCEFFLNILEQAWNHPWQRTQQIPILNLLIDFLTVANNNSLQHQMARSNKLSLLIDICNQYSITFDILWALSFNTEIQEQLRANSTFMFKLAQIEKFNKDDKIRKSIHGILWNLKLNRDEHVTPEKNQGNTFDIMISYSHADKELCKQIYKELIRKGYHVWVDFDQIHGNVMDAMAHAIEQSNTIIICMSEHYQLSNYCRAEANYAFQRRLKIVPVVLQNHYKPDGWLLFLIGQLFYVNFTKYDFLEAFDLLIKELEAPVLCYSPDQNMELRSEPDIVISSSSLQLSISHPLALPDNVLDWSQAQVSEWLISHNLVQMARLLSDYDGRSLIQLDEYMIKANSQQILMSFQEDSVRRMNQSLSMIELAHFRSLLDERRQRFVQNEVVIQSEKTNIQENKNDSKAICRIM